MTDHTTPAPDSPCIVARFPTRRNWEKPVKNFQTCALVYAGVDSCTPSRSEVLASVRRFRKTKRSVWTVEVRQMASTPWMSPAEYRAYYTAIADAALRIEWPDPEVSDA